MCIIASWKNTTRNKIMSNSITFTNNDNGITFKAVMIYEGDRYGRDNCLINDEEALVEFYDTRFPHTKHGQFISRYFAKTLIGECEYSYGDISNGMNLDGGIPSWTISAKNGQAVVDWIKAEIAM
jgi:hypothetical protein